MCVTPPDVWIGLWASPPSVVHIGERFWIEFAFAYIWNWYAGMDNWSWLHTKLVSLCPDFTKDSEVCRKKWSAVYTDYKEDKTMNMKSGSQRSKKFRWYQLVDEFIFNRANVVSHAYASTINPDNPKCTATSDTNTTEQWSRESTSKSPKQSARTTCSWNGALVRLERVIGFSLKPWRPVLT